jgi:hypothetical protein
MVRNPGILPSRGGIGAGLPVVKALITPAVKHSPDEPVSHGLRVGHRPAAILTTKSQFQGSRLRKHVIGTFFLNAIFRKKTLLCLCSSKLTTLLHVRVRHLLDAPSVLTTP